MKKRILAMLLSVCMLVSLMAAPAAAVSYTDADSIPTWAKPDVEKWSDLGILSAEKDGSFDPTHQLTRGEFAVLMCKLMGYTEKADPSTFVDLPDDAEQADALLKLNAAGVMLGVGNGRADPGATLTREHVAVMMFRALNMKADPDAAPMTFTDADRVSDWAKVEMTTMSALKLIEGVGDNTLAPKRDIPKQDMAALLSKMVAVYVTKDGTTVDTAKDESIVNPNGAVIILARNVKIAGAKDSGSILIAPGAPKNTTVTVTGETGPITVAAPGAKVTVNKGGKVASIAVVEGADNAAVTANSGAKVDSVTTSAAGVKVNGAKDTIGTVVAAAGSAEVKAKGAKVDVGDADVKVDGKSAKKNSTVTSNQTGVDAGSSGGSYTPAPSPSITVLADGKTPGGKLAVGTELTYSVNVAGSVVWVVGGFEVEGTGYTVAAADLGKTIYAKFTPTGKDPIESTKLEVETSAPLDTDDEDAPVILGDVTYQDDNGDPVTVTEDSKLVLTIEEKTDATPAEITAAKTDVQPKVQASVVDAIKGEDGNASVTLTDKQKDNLAAATVIKAVDVDLTLVTETTNADGETETDETPVHPVGTTTVKLSAAQLGMEGEDLNLYHFVASHTNKDNESQTVPGTVDPEGKTVTFVTNGLSTIWVGNVPPRTVTFDTGDGGTEVASQQVKFGNRVNTKKLPAKIERSGWLFCGWEYDLTVTPILDNMIIKAVWVQGTPVPEARITATLSAADSNIDLTKDAGEVTVAAKKDAETFTASLKVDLSVANLTGAVKYGVSQDAQTAAAIQEKDMSAVGASVALGSVTVTDGSGKVVAGKTSYYIKWINAKDEVTLEEVVIVVDDGKGAADSMTVTRDVDRGLGRFEPYLTSSTKTGAPNWVGYINGHLNGWYGSTEGYRLNCYVGFNDYFEGVRDEETGEWKYDPSPRDYDTLNLEFTPFTGESFTGMDTSALNAYFEYSAEVDGYISDGRKAHCTPTLKDGKLVFTLDLKTLETPKTWETLDLELYLTVDGVESWIDFWGVPNPKYTGVTQEGSESASFTDMATLKTALANATAAPSKDWYINYNGEGTEFTISESITIPANASLVFGSRREFWNADEGNTVEEKSVAVTVANGATVTLNCGENDAAYISVPYQGSFTVAQGGKLVTVFPNYQQSGWAHVGISCSQITVNGTIEVRSNSGLSLYRSWDGDNGNSTCTLGAGSQLTANGPFHIRNFKTVNLGGTVDVNSAGRLYLHSDNNVVSGTINVKGGDWDNAEFYGTTTITSTGKVNVTGTGSRRYAAMFDGPLDNKGTITIASNAMVHMSNAGFTLRSSGTIELNGFLYLNGTKLVNTGTITGSGEINGGLGEDTTSYDENNGLEHVRVTGEQTPDNYSRYKFTGDPAETVEVTLYKAGLVDEQGGTTANTITKDFEEFPAN